MKDEKKKKFCKLATTIFMSDLVILSQSMNTMYNPYDKKNKMNKKTRITLLINFRGETV